MSAIEVQRQVRDILDRLERLEKPDLPLLNIAARVYNSGNQSISNNTTTALTFDSERWDTDGIHSTSSNTSRLTCTRAGKHLIVGHVRWALNTTGMREIGIRLNGATFLAVLDATPNASFDHVMVVTTIWDMAVGDYVELTTYQNSGGALNAVASPNYANEFMIQRLP